MSKQIFKDNVPKTPLFDLLNKICTKTDKYYLLNNIAFKKGEYDNSIIDFCKSIQPYYHKSKEHYVTRKMTYSKFTTIVRQICKNNHILFTSKIKYDKSRYDILYFIYY